MGNFPFLRLPLPLAAYLEDSFYLKNALTVRNWQYQRYRLTVPNLSFDRVKHPHMTVSNRGFDSVKRDLSVGQVDTMEIDPLHHLIFITFMMRCDFRKLLSSALAPGSEKGLMKKCHELCLQSLQSCDTYFMKAFIITQMFDSSNTCKRGFIIVGYFLLDWHNNPILIQ